MEVTLAPALDSAGLPFLREIALLLLGLAMFLASLSLIYWCFFIARRAAWLQFEIDLQVIDLGDEKPYLGEVIISLENRGTVPFRLRNLFCEVRQSRHADNPPIVYVPPVNVLGADEPPVFIPPSARHAMNWSFEIPRHETVVRVSALYNRHWRRMPDLELNRLSHKHLHLFGSTAVWTQRLFQVAPRRQGDKVGVEPITGAF